MSFATDTVFTGAETVSAQAPLSPAELAPHFPQLEILECLGRGGMGVVYKARQRTLNRLVALKLLAPERVTDQAFAARFSREAQALAQLSHPNIVTVHDFGQAGGYFYLLMEFVDGANLRQLLRTRKLKPEEALAIVPPLCEALQFAHERGIVHRDIKPENLLLGKDGRVKVADFGIAKMLGAEGADEQPLGTPPYTAPEQITTPDRVDNRADIYSLGIVFYEMLTGELPGDKLVPPSRKVQIDVRLDEIVLRALEKTPERRWRTAAAMGTEVQTVIMQPMNADPTPGASRTSPGDQTARKSPLSQRERIILMACLGAGVLFLGFFLITTMRAPQTPTPAISHDLRTNEHDSAKAVASWQSNLDELKRKITAAQAKADKLQAELGISDSDTRATPSTSETETLRRLQENRMDKQEEYRQHDTLFKHMTGLTRAEFRQAISAVNPDTQLNTLLENLASTEQKLALMLEKYTDKHPEVMGVMRLREAIERQIDQRLDNILEGMRTKRDVLRAQLDTAEKEIALAQEQIEVMSRRRPYYEARRELESLQELRDRLETRIAEAKLGLAAFPSVSNEPQPPPVKGRPGRPTTNELKLARLKVEQAQAELERVSKLHTQGLVDQYEMIKAHADLELRRAELAGDPVAVARVKVKQAEAELERVSRLAQVGLAGNDLKMQAQFELEARQTELEIELERSQTTREGKGEPSASSRRLF